MAVEMKENELSFVRQDILRVLRTHAGEPLSPQEIQQELPHMTRANLAMTLKRMYKRGQIEKLARGAYCIKSN